MNCIHCGSQKVFVFLTEKIPCSCCDNHTDICYCTCESCGNIWRTMNGSPIEEEYMVDPDVDKSSNNGLVEAISFPKDSSHKAKIKDESIQCDSTMSEMFHKCLRCEHIAYETSRHCFHCPVCGFEWEVI